MADVSTAADEPDPLRAQNPAGFVEELNHLRVWAGQPAYRQLSRLADGRPATEPLSASTVQEVLAGKRLPRLPKLPFTESFVTACMRARGATPEQTEAAVERWRTAWRALASEETAVPSTVDDVPPPEVRAAPARNRRLLAALVLVAVFLAGAATGVVGTRLATGDDDDRANTPAANTPSTSTPGTGGGQQQTQDCAGSAERPAGTDVIAGGAERWWTSNEDKVTLTVTDRAWNATVATGMPRPWDLLILRRSVTLQTGRRYALVFTVSASASLVIVVRVQDSRPQDYTPSLHQDLPVGPQPCHRTFTFVGAKTSSASEVTFQLGGHAQFDLSVRDFALIDVGPAG